MHTGGLFQDEDDPEAGEKQYQKVCAEVQDIIKGRPELQDTPIEELVAVREWTGNTLWKVMQDLLMHDITEENWDALSTMLPTSRKISLVEGLPLVKAIISGLNALPIAMPTAAPSIPAKNRRQSGFSATSQCRL
ncbi:hypothetical protein ACFQUU_28235 [Herbaspirillum sp. GCM10030257]|uniref:hypothetical protein n=1 Tax=Herbaspirillum sp. GCM10030257 TaxID=3273393 RepID=UPI0036196D1D